MPQSPYTVTFPDGKSVSFTGPDSMSDLDVQTRAIQERGFKDGQIPTSWLSGAAKQLGTEKGTTGAAITGLGLLAGGPVGAGIVAGAPLAAEAIKYGTTGEAPSTADLATDAAMGAATLAPAAFAKTGAALATEVGNITPGLLHGGTLPQALAKAGARLVAPVAEDAGMLSAQAVSKTGADLWEAMKQTAIRTKAGVSADDVDLMRQTVQQGFKPATAAKIVSGGNTRQFLALMKLYRRPVVGLTK